MKYTPLHNAHIKHNAKLVDFTGWDMPIHYTGILDEYQTVRQQAGLFDVSHMGRIMIEGEDAIPFLQQVSASKVAAIEVLASQYAMLCNPQGGIKDDVFIYRLAPKKFLLCVNASNHEKILDWLQEQQAQLIHTVEVIDRSQDIAQLALQGPASIAILRNTLGTTIDHLPPRGCLECTISSISLLLTRTGYTGELGYELYVPADRALDLWSALIVTGKPYGLKPAGLGARDLLRLDMGYLLYGNDITEDTTPIEAGAAWLVDWQNNDFIGQPVLTKQREEGTTRCLVAFELLQKSVPRHGMPIFDEHKEIGQVTSGNLSPILQKGIGLGYVLSAHAHIGAPLFIDIRGRRVPAIVVKPPFYKRRKS
ncbi:MAG: glycine cleavage system aminomethyltransferase GcvT [Nitrospirales bacterium]|nr:glycine cleavage system aminomethyltransferase GcvT [Nitrospirales bacterium]